MSNDILSLLILSNFISLHNMQSIMSRYEITEEGYIDDITKEKCSAQLVVRRGQGFQITLSLDRAFNEKHDKIKIISKIGVLL